ncbi:MAG: dienelactone hydrolase family protein [Chloroflexi bacterium]|nr:dienelactone hydrolase family protein [Chloroflexota bacterium]
MARCILSLHAGDETGGDFVDGYVARPATPGPHPGLVVISGMGGLNWFQGEITCAFARGGFVAVAPDLFDDALPLASDADVEE